MKMPYNLTALIYHDRLAVLKITTLTYRRKRCDVITAFKDLHANQAFSPSTPTGVPGEIPRQFANKLLSAKNITNLTPKMFLHFRTP
jgi:hypothetical protein